MRIATSLLVSIFVVSCTIPSRTIVPFVQSTGKIKSLEIVLEQPTFIPEGNALDTLEKEGWTNGSMGRKFCDDLAARLLISGVTAYCGNSFWGRQIYNENRTSQTATHVLSIRPIRLHYVVTNQIGPPMPGFNPVFETVSQIKNKQTGTLVWAAEISANFAPVDSTGARRYANSLIDLLQTAGAK